MHVYAPNVGETFHSQILLISKLKSLHHVARPDSNTLSKTPIQTIQPTFPYQRNTDEYCRSVVHRFRNYFVPWNRTIKQMAFLFVYPFCERTLHATVPGQAKRQQKTRRRPPSHWTNRSPAKPGSLIHMQKKVRACDFKFHLANKHWALVWSRKSGVPEICDWIYGRKTSQPNQTGIFAYVSLFCSQNDFIMMCAPSLPVSLSVFW